MKRQGRAVKSICAFVLRKIPRRKDEKQRNKLNPLVTSVPSSNQTNRYGKFLLRVVIYK